MKKRIFSLLIAVCMIFNFMPLSAFAADNGIAMPAAEAVGSEATPPANESEATPPANGGEATPPANKGEATPPANGGEATPPANKGEATPPANKSEATPPANKGEATPPLINEKLCTCTPVIGIGEGGHAVGCPLYVAVPTAEEKLCTCTEKCTTAANPNCPVCNAAGADLAALCKGNAPVAMVLATPRAVTWAGGDGTENTPYLIATPEQLTQLATEVNQGTDSGYKNKFFKLTVNISLNNAPWVPIGAYNDNKPFAGTFDGGNFEVQNIKIDAPNADYQGLFGYVSTDGTVKNVGVTGAVSGKGNVGGVVGYNEGAVQSCYNSATVTGTGEYVGGVVGLSRKTVKSCYNTGAVSGTSAVGGVLGGSDSASSGLDIVESCYNTGTVSGTSRVGGVAGSSANVTNCVSLGASVVCTDSVNGTEFGRIIGFLGNSATLTGNKARGDMVVDGKVLRGNAATVGADKIDGEIVTVGDGTVLDTVFTPAMGFTDANGWGTINKTYLKAGEPLPTLKGFTASQSPTLPAGAEPWEGVGTNVSPYLIKTVVDLQDLAIKVSSGTSYAGKYFKMTGHIDLIGIPNWTPIGQADSTTTVAFGGNFDGGNFEVQNLTIDAPTAGQQGLFGYVAAGGVVKNLGITGSVTGNDGVGSVAGVNSGTIESCNNSATIIGTAQVGGVVGVNFEKTAVVKSCNNSATVTGTGDKIGGVAGMNSGTIESCNNSAAVTGAGLVGGVVGAVELDVSTKAIVKSCYNSATVTGTGDKIGGVAGANTGEITICYNTAPVSGAGFVGGVVGAAEGTSSKHGSVKFCYNSAAVTGTKNKIGGVAGANTGDITICYNTGTVSGAGLVGGVVGSHHRIMTDCYNTGTVKGVDGVGGVMGSCDGSIATNHCYNIGTVEGVENVGGVIGSTSAAASAFISLGARVVYTGTGTSFGRVAGSAGRSTLSANKARGDMVVNGKAVSEDSTTTIADGNNGKTVAVGDGTLQSTVFDNNFSSTIWEVPTGALTIGAKLPTLKTVGGTQNPTLPDVKKDIGASITFADGKAEYNGNAQAYEKASYTGGNGSFTYKYVITNGGTLENGKPKGAGTYTVTAAYDSATENGSATATFTINPKQLAAEAVTVSGSYTYTGLAQTPAVAVADGSTALALNTDYTYSTTDNINAGTAKVAVTFSGNYGGTVNTTFIIGKAPLTISGGTVSEKTYDGTTTATVTSLNFYVSNNPITFATSNYTVGTPTFTTANVGTSIDVKGIAALAGTATANNYTLADGAYTLKGDIVKGAYGAPPTKTINIQNGAVRTGTITLADIFGGNIPADAAFGAVTAPSTPNIMAGVTQNGSNLTYTSQNNTGTKPDDVYTVKVTCKNYADFDVTITFKALNKTAVTIQGITTQAGLIYSGKPQKGYTGTVKVEGDSVNVNELVYTYIGTGYNSATAPTDAGSYTLVVSVPGSNAAYTGSASVSFAIAQAPLSVTAASYEVYRYKKAPDLTKLANTLIYSGFVNGEGMGVLGGKYSAAYAKAVDTTKTGTTDIDVSITGAETNTNYAITKVKGKLTVHEALPTGQITTALPTAPATDPAVVAQANGSKTLRLIIGNLMPTEKAQTEAWLNSAISGESLRASHEVELQVSEDGGITWRLATAQDIKGGKAQAVLPLPANTSALTHELFVYHFAKGADKAATLEAAAYNEKAKALVAEVTSFSPFVVVAIPKGASKPITPPTPPAGGTDSTDSENQFWISIVTLIQGTKKGDVLKIDTGAYTKMPACVMEELRIKGAGMIIKQNGGKDIVIPAGKAASAENARAIWPLAELAKMYGKYSLGSKTNPSTGVKAYGIADHQAGVTTPITGSIVDAATAQGGQRGKYIPMLAAGAVVIAFTAFGVIAWARKKEEEEE